MTCLQLIYNLFNWIKRFFLLRYFCRNAKKRDMNIVHSKFNSLSFDNDWRAYFDEEKRYVQKFAQNEEIRLQFVLKTQGLSGKYIDRLGVETPVTLNIIYVDSKQTEKLFLYEGVFSVPDTGFYEFIITDSLGNEEKTYFEIRTDEELQNTVLIRYTNRKNDFDTIFSDEIEEERYFNFRIEGGFYPGDKTQNLENSVFRDQNFRLSQISAFPYEISVLTIGDPCGVPQWVGNKINHIFCLSDVEVNGKRMVRSEASVPEMTSVAGEYPLYVFKLSLEEAGPVIEEELIWYSVTYDSQGGSPVSGSPFTVLAGTIIYARGTARSGFTFDGWATSPLGAGVYGFGAEIMVNSNMTLYARWKSSSGGGDTTSYPLVYDLNGGEIANYNGGTEPGSYSAGTAITMPTTAPTRVTPSSAYEFAGWLESSVIGELLLPGQSSNSGMIAGGLLYIAQWTPKILYRGLPTGDYSIIVPVGSMHTIIDFDPEWVPAGAVFAGWALGSGGSYQPGQTIQMPSTGLNFNVMFGMNIPEEFILTFLPGADPELVFNLPEPAWIEEGRYITANYNPYRLGYTLVGWQRDDTEEIIAVGGHFFMPSYNLSITAIWEEAQYRGIEYDPNGGTLVPYFFPIPALVEGEVYTIIPKATLANNIFKGWESSVNHKIYQQGDTYLIPAADTTFTAVWELITYAFNYDLNTPGGASLTFGNGTMPGNYAAGTTITMPPEAPICYGRDFLFWLAPDEGIQPGQSFSMPEEDFWVKALWNVINYQLSYNFDGGDVYDWGNYSGAGTYPYGTTIYPPVPEKSGYTFVGWYWGNGHDKGTYLPGASFALAGDTSLRALWKEIVEDDDTPNKGEEDEEDDGNPNDGSDEENDDGPQVHPPASGGGIGAGEEVSIE
jgi:uncharacterized repeat protein (TIGR02543 family)